MRTKKRAACIAVCIGTVVLTIILRTATAPQRAKDAPLCFGVHGYGTHTVARVSATVGSKDALVDALIQALETDRNPYVRAASAGALGVIRRKDAIPALARALDDADCMVRGTAVDALEKYGNKATPAFTQALASTQYPSVRVDAVQAITAIDPNAATILTQALKNENPDVRVAAAWGLMSQIPEATDTIPTSIIVESLGYDEYVVWQLYNDISVALGRRGRDAVPDLIQALESSGRWRTRHAAAQILGRIGPETKDAVPTLITRLESDSDERVRGAAAVALGQIATPDAVEALFYAQQHNGSKRVRSLVGHVLEDVTPNALIPLLAAPEWEIRVYAANRLGHHTAKDVVPALIQTMEQDEDWRVRHAAVEALARIGFAASDATPALVQVLHKDENECVRGAAAVALGKIAPGSRHWTAAREALIYAAEEDEHPGLRAIAITALANIGPEEEIAPVLTQAIPDLVQSLQDERGHVREAAARALGYMGNIGPEAAEAVPALILALDDEDSRVRRDVVQILGSIGPGAVEAVPALIVALDHKEFRCVNEAAAEALEKITGQDFGTDPEQWQAWWEGQQ